ncbi:MAG: hypothetical protein AAFN11_05565 [Chloroflexota bacterium]
MIDNNDYPKSKRQHTLPNRQLARAFAFSAADLAANRHGYITRAQSWQIPLWIRGTFQSVQERLGFSESKRRQIAASICGRATLRYRQHQIESIFHADFVEIHELEINNMVFRLSAHQHTAIADGVVYRLYYDADTKHILSLERAFNGCQ